MSRALLVAASVLSAPGTAVAAPFGELAPRAVHDAKRSNFYAYLVERPGEPALLAREPKGGPRRFAVRFKHRPTGTSVVILTGDGVRGIVRRNRVAVR